MQSKAIQMKRDIKTSFDSHKGMNRNRNKDGILLVKAQPYTLIGVFDGVSSSSSSHKAVKKAISFINNNHEDYYAENNFRLSELIIDTNKLLISNGMIEPYTTCSLLYVPHNIDYNIKYTNIGDSRIYAVSPQFIDQLTKDDSDSHYKNILLKCLGMEDLKSIDIKEDIYNGEAKRFLICSDGFYNIFEGNNKFLLKVHKALNLKQSYYIKYNLNKLISGRNNDDASYALVRYEYV